MLRSLKVQPQHLNQVEVCILTRTLQHLVSFLLVRSVVDLLPSLDLSLLHDPISIKFNCQTDYLIFNSTILW